MPARNCSLKRPLSATLSSAEPDVRNCLTGRAVFLAMWTFSPLERAKSEPEKQLSKTKRACFDRILSAYSSIRFRLKDLASSFARSVAAVGASTPTK